MKQLTKPVLAEVMFDRFHYAAQSGRAGTEADLRRHFAETGKRLGLSPSPLFDRRFYARQYPDVADQGMDGYEHFLAWGSAEHRSPCAVFDAKWYGQRRAAEGRAVEHPVLHYLTLGLRAGLRPHPLFWADWYRKTYLPDTEAGIDPLGHYLSEGWRAGNAPNPLFDPNHYSSRHMRDADAPREPLAHFLALAPGDPTLSPHPLFDGAHYLAALADRGNKPAGSAYEDYLTGGDDAAAPSPHPFFDPAYYRRGCGLAAFDKPALVDYVLRGEKAPDPHPLFSRSHYLQASPDVGNLGLDPLTHYVNAGQTEARPFHPLFDITHYRKKFGDPGATCLADYLARGMAGGRGIRPKETPDTTVRRFSGMRRVLDMPLDAPLLSKTPVSTRQRIGIFAHIFYTDLAEEMITAANAAPQGPTRLFISTDTPQKAREIEGACARHTRHPFEIRITPNRGRDIAPMLVGYADRLAEVDVGLHIHSKKSRHYAREFAAWRQHLLKGNLGSERLVANILDTLATPGIGAYAPDHFTPIRALIQWGGNFASAQKLVRMMGHELSREAPLDLPTGSMFWFRSEALRPLLDLRLDYAHFDPEKGQLDGTLAHAIERLFFHTVEMAGFAHVTGRAVKGPVPAIDRAKLALHGNRILPAPRDLGEARHYMAHCRHFLALPSDEPRPRLNLLIPTGDTSRAYAGVATALDVFHATRGRLGREWDARMIFTDTAPGNQYLPPDNFRMAEPGEADRGGEDIVIDGTRRQVWPLAVRDGDIFLATAWWTAHAGRNLLAQQDRLFGARTRKLGYLIQDYECGFHAWSTEWALCDATYRVPATTIPVFNTQILADFFHSEGYFSGSDGRSDGHVLLPALNRDFQAALRRGAPKEKIVLLYARPHAERNCLSFLDMLVHRLHTDDASAWRDWRFIAIGEDFAPDVLRCKGRIEIAGRLSLADYADIASRAALAVSLMVSPHPSYPPLEMAEAGVRVLTNRYGSRDLSGLHDNLHSFTAFDLDAVARQLGSMAGDWHRNPNVGWQAKPRVDWFFAGRSNLDTLADGLAHAFRVAIGPRSEALPATPEVLRLVNRTA